MHIYEDIKDRANFWLRHYAKTESPSCIAIRASLFLFLDRQEGKENLPKSRQSFEPNFLYRSILFSLVKLVFSIASVCLLINSCDHNWTRCTIRDTRLLYVGSKLLPSNIQRMLNENVIRFTQSLLKYSKNWASKRKFLLARLG